LAHDKLSVAHDNLVQDHTFLTKELSNGKIKTSESSSHGSIDQSNIVANPCDEGKKHVSTSCDDLLAMSCSSNIDAFSTSMSYETNLLKENNELKNEVKNLSNKLERCYNSRVTFEHMLKTQRSYGDKRGVGFNKKSMTNCERKRERKMKKQEKERLSHFRCFKYHEGGILQMVTPTKKSSS
jgi:hypothetical protein